MRPSSRQRLVAFAFLAFAAIHLSAQIRALHAFRAFPPKLSESLERRTWKAAALRVSTEPLASVFEHSNRREGRGWSGVVTRTYIVLTNPGTSITRNIVVFALANTLISFSVVILGGAAVRWLLLNRRRSGSASPASP